MLTKALASVGRRGINTCASFGRAGLMLFRALIGKPQFAKQWPLLVKQLYSVGVLSLLIIPCPVCLSAWCLACRAI